MKVVGRNELVYWKDIPLEMTYVLAYTHYLNHELAKYVDDTKSFRLRVENGGIGFDGKLIDKNLHILDTKTYFIVDVEKTILVE